MEEIAQDINTNSLDIVCLQELDRGGTRAGGKNLLRMLSQKTLPYYRFFPAIGLPGNEYGIGILSGIRLRRWSCTGWRQAWRRAACWEA